MLFVHYYGIYIFPARVSILEPEILVIRNKKSSIYTGDLPSQRLKQIQADSSRFKQIQADSSRFKQLNPVLKKNTNSCLHVR